MMHGLFHADMTFDLDVISTHQSESMFTVSEVKSNSYVYSFKYVAIF